MSWSVIVSTLSEAEASRILVSLNGDGTIFVLVEGGSTLPDEVDVKFDLAGGGEIDLLDRELRKAALLERMSSGCGLSTALRFPNLSGMSILWKLCTKHSLLISKVVIARGHRDHGNQEQNAGKVSLAFAVPITSVH
jgi:hypothetical protein